MSKMTDVEKQLVAAGVGNLREFGYPSCTAENILTDRIYSQFFKSMLADNRGKSARADVAIESLLTRIAGPSAAREDPT